MLQNKINILKQNRNLKENKKDVNQAHILEFKRLDHSIIVPTENQKTSPTTVILTIQSV